MPITSSAKKRLRQEAKRRARNLTYLAKIKAVQKQIRKLAGQKKNQEAGALLPKAYKALDKAAKARVIKKGQAVRRKSRLAKLLAQRGDK